MKKRHLIFLGVAGLWVAVFSIIGMNTDSGQEQGIYETLGNGVALLWIPAIVFYLGFFIYDRIKKPKASKPLV